MNKMMAVAVMGFLLLCGGYAFADEKGHATPAPNSGDGVSDGSGYDAPSGPKDTGSGVSSQGYGEPAPNCGDGISDGSGR
ncbi:MAG: hypothetical protein NC924_07510 [Candidatus Omnitrophica bacterium]|nr:hypothetical protein [Candidatus Omnitrophota bacterium]